MLTYIIVSRPRQTPDNQQLHAKIRNIWEGRCHTGKCVFVGKRWGWAVGESVWMCNTEQCWNLASTQGCG